MSKAAGHFKNVPAPEGSKVGSGYGRFIPAEELGQDFASWQPGNLGADRRTDNHAERRSEPRTGPAAAAAASTRETTPEEWQARITATRQAGYQEGYRDGLVALESFKQSFAQQATAQVGALLQSFDDQLSALDTQIGDALSQTAVLLARQVLRTELQQRPGLVAAVAAEAVSAIMLSARQITVRVHPQDLPLVAEGADETLRARGARLQADPTIERGGVMVLSDVGAIDARLCNRWVLAAAAFGSEATLIGACDDTEGAADGGCSDDSDRGSANANANANRNESGADTGDGHRADHVPPDRAAAARQPGRTDASTRVAR
ncbi:MAG: flagellar assembly protein FliH [Rubrivivax sp.]